MFKKYIIVSLLALCLVTPNLVKAQTVAQEQLNAQLLVLIQDLMAQVQVLMAKLIAIEETRIAPVVVPVVQPTIQTPVLGSQTPTLITWIDLPQDNPYPTATPKQEEWSRVISNYNHNRKVPSDNICNNWQYRVDTFGEEDSAQRLEACHTALNAIKALFAQ
jgi:hypothetical protein